LNLLKDNKEVVAFAKELHPKNWFYYHFNGKKEKANKLDSGILWRATE